MSEPVFDPVAERIYSKLPEHFRRVDPTTDYTLKRIIGSITPAQAEVEALVERFDYTPPEDGGDPDDPENTSALVDPRKADPAWFPWLAQLYGARLTGSGIENQRYQILGAAQGYRAGTPGAIEDAARTQLVGDRYAKVYPRSDLDGVGQGGPWDLLLVTKSSETLRNLVPEPISISSSVSSIQNDIVLTRYNYVPNPSFETNTTGWSTYKVAGADPLGTHITVASSTEQSQFGTKSAKISFDDPTYAGGIQATISENSTNAPLTLTFSAYVYAPSDVISSEICLSVTDWASNTYESEILDTPSSWQRLSVSFAIPATGSGNITYRIGSKLPNTQTSVVFFYADGVMVEPNTGLPFEYFDSTTETKYYPFKTVNSAFSGYHRQIADVGKTTILTTEEGVFENRAISVQPDPRSQYDDSVDRKTYDALDMKMGIVNKIPVTPGDEHQIMFKARTGTQFVDVTLAVSYRDNTGAEIPGTLTTIDTISLTDDWQQFNLWTPASHASAAFMDIFLTMDEIKYDLLEAKFVTAEWGVRQETSEIWVPKTVDPVQVVIDLGAKPAGYKLHHAMLATTWDTIETVYGTWSEIDGETWEEVEESGVSG